MRIKRVLSLLLTVAMLLSLAANFVQAADTPEEALGEVNIFNGGQSLNCLAVNGRVQELNYVYYRYVGVAGTREIPAYCVNPTDAGVPQKVAAGQSIAYTAHERASDPKVMGIVANGYPTKSLGELGLQDKVEGYYATKIALWCYIIPGWSISNVTINPALSGDAKVQAQRVLAAAKRLTGHARAAGNSLVLNGKNGAPVLAGSCVVYGKVTGNIRVMGKAVILGGETIDHDHADTLILDGLNRAILSDPQRNRLTPSVPHAPVVKKPRQREQVR